MLKNVVVLSSLVVAGMGLCFLAGCESKGQSSALIGGAIGAGVGALAGGDTEGALIGAAVGTGAGYIVGNEADKKTATAQSNTVTVWITNSNGSKTPVTLTRQGAGYVGTKNEYYDTMPIEDQLRPVYGF